MTSTQSRPHSCGDALLESTHYNPFRCAPAVFECWCGRTWVHVCDEAEGCYWAKEAEDD